MVEDRPESIEPAPDLGRAKRAPPTIDLEASEVTGDTRNIGADAPPETVAEPAAPAISTWAVAAVSGLVAASLVICVAWILGWPAPAARLDALEKSLAALRGDLAGLHAQAEKLAAAVNDVKAIPRESSASPDLAAINERIAGIERATRAQSAEIAQEGAKPVDDMPLRRIVAASLLDVLVRIGDPYPAALAAAKSLASSPDALTPLDGFAVSGVPSANALSRELLTLVPKLSPPQQENSTTGLVDRLQAGAAKLVRIERTDAVGNTSGAVVARVTAAALRNEFAEARRELKTLAPADRAAAQAWLDKADARDAALAVSRQFAADAMSALAKPGQ